MNHPTPPPESSSPAQALSAAPIPPVAKRGRLTILQGSVPRFVGYGLLGLFAIDVVGLLLDYKPLVPQADAGLVTQLVERAAIPLLAYALIFATNISSAERAERTWLKLVSAGSMVLMAVYLALSVMAVTANYRLYLFAGYNISKQASDRVAAIEKGRVQVATATDLQLLAAYRQIDPSVKLDAPPKAELMRAAIDKQLPPAIDATNLAAANARTSVVRQLIIAGTKYFLGAMITAVLFLVIWENTRYARSHHIFAPKSAPSMAFEDKLAGAMHTTATRMEEAFFLPSLEKYRWYRKLRRFFGGRRH